MQRNNKSWWAHSNVCVLVCVLCLCVYVYTKDTHTHTYKREGNVCVCFCNPLYFRSYFHESDCVLPLHSFLCTFQHLLWCLPVGWSGDRVIGWLWVLLLAVASRCLLLWSVGAGSRSIFHMISLKNRTAHNRHMNMSRNTHTHTPE